MDIRRRLRALDGYQQHHSWVGFPLAVVKKFSDDQAGNLAALIAYYGFFSLFPLLLVLVTVLGLVLNSDPSLQNRVLHSALGNFPVIGGQLRANVHSLNRVGLGLGFGLLGTFYGARGVASAAQNAFNSVWEVPYKDRPGFPKNTLRSLALVTVGGLGVIVTTSLSTLGGGSSGTGVAIRIGCLAGALLLNVLVFWTAFRLATAKVVPTRDLLFGAILAAIVWQILQAVGGYLVGHELQHSSQVYGMFGLVLGLLSWLYLQAEFTLYAVEVDVVRKRGLWPRALFPPPLTTADRAAYESYTKVQERRQPQQAQLEVNQPVREPSRN